jgi:hypothetical protein
MPVEGIAFETNDGSDVLVTAHVGPDRVLVTPGESALGVSVGDDNVVTMDAPLVGSGRRLQSNPEILLRVVPPATVQWVRTRSSTVCHANEYVSNHVCVMCPPGTQNSAGGDPVGADTACTAILTCTGNADPGMDVACNTGQTPKAGSEAIVANTNAACCDDMPAQLEYLWEVTPFSPLHCATECGANPDRTRQVTCIQFSSYAGGDRVRAVADDEARCTEPRPEDTSPCDTYAVGATCVDGNDETMDDVCIAGGVCQGKVQLVSAATFPLDITTLVVPKTTGMLAEAAEAELNASPVAVAVKSGIATSLGVAVDAITIKSIAAGSVVVEYVVALPASEVDAAKDASETAAPTVTIPAAASTSGVALATVTGDVTALTSYAYVRVSMCEHDENCSNVCGSNATTAADQYTCLENGLEIAGTTCASLGPVPATVTECCPAAEPATCVGAAPVPGDEAIGYEEDNRQVWLYGVLVAAVLCCIGSLACTAYRCRPVKPISDAKKSKEDTDVEHGHGPRGVSPRRHTGANTPPRGVSPGRCTKVSTPPRGVSPVRRTTASTPPRGDSSGKHTGRATSPMGQTLVYAPSFPHHTALPPAAPKWATQCWHGDQCTESKHGNHAKAYWHPPSWHQRP